VTNENRLIGTWTVDPSDEVGFRRYGNTTMEFKDDGSLTYRIITDDGKHQLMFLTYKVDGNTLVTNQSSHPREDRTEFELVNDNVLRLTHSGTRVTYCRSSKRVNNPKSWWSGFKDKRQS
jgi:hypothetical protein